MAGEEKPYSDGQLCNLNNHDVDAFALTETEMIDLFAQMMSNYGLLVRFSIDEMALKKFLGNLCDTYRSNNEFHNFKHAWAVTHLCYIFLGKGVDRVLLPLDILCLLISAICHDVDHPGNSNGFEVAIRSDLALRYSNASVLENHHIAVATELISRPGLNILDSLTDEEKSSFFQNMAHAIMMTDMAVHGKIVDEVATRAKSAEAAIAAAASNSSSSATTDSEKRAGSYNSDSVDDRRILIGHILHAADIGAQTQATSIAEKWTESVSKEFSDQARKELERGLPPTQMMHGLDDDLKKMQSQAGFLKFVVIPLWTHLKIIFNQLDYAVQQAVANMNYYQAKADALLFQEGNKKNESK